MKNGNLIVRADLPGFDPKDVEISVLGNVLTIRGERKEEKEVKKDDYTRREISYGALERRLTLPEGTATDKIKATFKNGVVEVSVPTAKGMEAKKIPLEADRDISMAAYIQGLPLTASLVTSAMSKQVFSCRADDDIAVAEKIMRDKQVRRLPVVDANNRPTGIISPNDIAREAERQQAARATRQVTDSEIARVMEAVCAPHHRVVAAQSL